MTRYERMIEAKRRVGAGVKPADAAAEAGVHLSALYRALRRDKARCETCGAVLRKRRAG